VRFFQAVPRIVSESFGGAGKGPGLFSRVAKVAAGALPAVVVRVPWIRSRKGRVRDVLTWGLAKWLFAVAWVGYSAV
jgi:hypothetical protein